MASTISSIFQALIRSHKLMLTYLSRKKKDSRYCYIWRIKAMRNWNRKKHPFLKEVDSGIPQESRKGIFFFFLTNSFWSISFSRFQPRGKPREKNTFFWSSSSLKQHSLKNGINIEMNIKTKKVINNLLVKVGKFAYPYSLFLSKFA